MAMTIRQLRVAIIASTLLQLIAVLFLFFGCSEVGSAYVMIIRHAGDDLPRLTSDVSLPLLRIAAGDPHNRPVTLPWVWLVWGVFIAGPAVVSAWALRADAVTESLARWLTGLSIYYPLGLLAAVVVVVGLALPFACL